jgi:hypothetical protein
MVRLFWKDEELIEIYNNSKWDNRHIAYLTKEQNDSLSIIWHVLVPKKQLVKNKKSE